MSAVLNHSRSFSDYLYVYPVISRRSGGLSIGVNLNPDKRCNFDCVYCEVDRITPARTKILNMVRMKEELVSLLQHVKSGGLAKTGRFAEHPDLALDIKDIAFSGDGEPTMIPNFCECARVVADVKRAEGLNNTKIVLITDAAGLDKTDVKEGLRILDENQGEIWGKLDAGTETYFQAVNRSHIRLDRILKNLLETAKVRPIVIQSLFFRLRGEIMPEAELNEYCLRLETLLKEGAQIKEVHAYTIARPTPEPFATRLTPEELNMIADSIRNHTGLLVRSFD